MLVYKVVFDQSGQVIKSNAPMVPAQQGPIDDYLPLFYDIKALEDLNLADLSPYECSIGNKKYFFQLEWTINELEDITIYELKIKDKTICYSDLQTERSTKNQLKIQQDYLINRLQKEVKANKIERSNNYELTTILKHTREGIIYQDRKTGEVVNANNKALELFKCTEVDDLNRVEHLQYQVSSILGYEPMLFDHIWKENKNSGNNEEVVLMGGKESTRKWYLIRANEENALGKETMNIIFVTDISRAYNASLSLKDKNAELLKYIESNVQLEQFAHVASHDLRSPIITIRSFAKLLEQKCGERLDLNESKYLSIIRNNANQMFDLVNDLLEYSKVNSQKITLSKVNMHSLVSSIFTSMGIAAEQTKIQMSIANTLPEVLVDEMKIKRVFQNILSNAIKFVDSSKESKITVDCKESEQQYEFIVSDNGIGIKKDAPDIFLPYTKLNLRRDYEGTGMGLAICKNIIDQHQGEIYYESQLGHGTQFVFTIKKEL